MANKRVTRIERGHGQWRIQATRSRHSHKEKVVQSIRIEQAKRTLNQRIDELADAEGHQVSPELLDLLTDCLTVLQGVHYEDNDIVGILNDVLARLVGQPKFEFQLPPETVFEDYLSKIRHQ